jgi:Telomerase ribonucleoprotein complex - RNA binding domain
MISPILAHSKHSMQQLITLIWGPAAPASPPEVNRFHCAFSSNQQQALSIPLLGTSWRSSSNSNSNALAHALAKPQVRLCKEQQKSVSKLLQTMAQKAEKLPWKVLLDFHCPILEGSFVKHKSDAQSQSQKGSRLPNSCAMSAVCGFLRAVLKRLIPIDLLGSRHNKRVVCKWAVCIACMGRFEDVTVHSFMQCMRTRDVHWLHPTCAPFESKCSSFFPCVMFRVGSRVTFVL